MKILLFCLVAASAPICPAQQPAAATSAPASAAFVSPHLPAGAKLYIEPMDGFETYLSAAMLKKKVPVIIVDDKAKADFILSGSSKVAEAGWAKTIFVSPNSHAEASILIKDAHDGSLVYAYSVDKTASRRGNQSTSEACAKHLKEFIDKGNKK